MKRTFVQIDGVLYERGSEPVSAGQMVMPDIAPYRSQIDGSIIASRSAHREHLRQHGCIEVGNEKLQDKRNFDVAPQQRRESIRSQIDAMTHREFRAAIKRDADRVKWNSRER